MVMAQGYVEAWFHLGAMYQNGWGVKGSAHQALYYFSLAAKMGHILAQYNLAMLHLQGPAADKFAALISFVPLPIVGQCCQAILQFVVA
jgi:TPR repeat protein